MITEDYVSFEVAKLLKDKGFNEECWEYYDNNKNFKSFRIIRCNYDNIPYKDAYIAPTHQMAMKWLREGSAIEISIACFELDSYRYDVYEIDSSYFRRQIIVDYNSDDKQHFTQINPDYKELIINH